MAPSRRAVASSPFVRAKTRAASRLRKSAPVMAAPAYSGLTPWIGMATTIATHSRPFSTIAEPRLCVAAPNAASVPEMPSRVKSR